MNNRELDAMYKYTFVDSQQVIQVINASSFLEALENFNKGHEDKFKLIRAFHGMATIENNDYIVGVMWQ